MKPITVYFPDDFEVPECERLEYRSPKEGEAYHNGTGEIFHISTIDFKYVKCFVAAQKKEFTYDWPDVCPMGAALKRTDRGWHYYYRGEISNSWDWFETILTRFNFPEPPADAPIGTVIVKGGKK